MGMAHLFPWPDNDWHRPMFEEYRSFGLGHGKDLHAGILSSRGKKTWHTSNIVNLCANTTCIGGTAGLARPGRTARSRRSPRPTA